MVIKVGSIKRQKGVYNSFFFFYLVTLAEVIINKVFILIIDFMELFTAFDMCSYPEQLTVCTITLILQGQGLSISSSLSSVREEFRGPDRSREFE